MEKCLSCTIDQSNGRSGAWTEDEDFMLNYSVRTHGGNNWDSIAALVLGRTKNSVIVDGIMP
jgi:hypothetical protein